MRWRYPYWVFADHELSQLQSTHHTRCWKSKGIFKAWSFGFNSFCVLVLSSFLQKAPLNAGFFHTSARDVLKHTILVTTTSLHSRSTYTTCSNIQTVDFLKTRHGYSTGPVSSDCEFVSADCEVHRTRAHAHADVSLSSWAFNNVFQHSTRKWHGAHSLQCTVYLCSFRFCTCDAQSSLFLLLNVLFATLVSPVHLDASFTLYYKNRCQNYNAMRHVEHSSGLSKRWDQWSPLYRL